MTESPRWIDYVPLRDLQRAARNPKRHATEELAVSVSRFGFVEPIVIDERTQRLVAGHGRLDELLRRAATGEPPPDGVRVDTDGTWMAPVVRGWASTSDDDADAYLLASNRLVELGGWDNTVLTELLAGLESHSFAGTGFDPGFLDELLRSTPAADVTVDTSSSDPQHTVTYGDVWELGPHVLVVADVATGHQQWCGFLRDGVVFAPYAGPYLAVITDTPLVAVQPDTWIAGHILDKYVAAHGSSSVRCRS